MQDDMLKHKHTVLEEITMYMTMGLDGIFVEFPHTTKSVYSYVIGSKKDDDI